ANLQSAVRLSATGRYLGLLFGPAVGGAFLLAFGPAYGLLLNALIYLPLVYWLWKAPYGPRFRKSTPATRSNMRRAVKGLSDIVSTIRDISGSRTIVPMILLAGLTSFFVGNGYQPQMPEFAHDLGHGDPDLSYSMLLAADAAGALFAGFLLESRGLLQAKPRTALLLAMLWCCAIGGFAASTSYPLALAILFAVGFLELSFNAMAQTLVQLHAPSPIRGRVIGLYILFALGMRAFSGITIGVVGGLIGIHWSLALSALLLLAATAALLAFTLRPARPT
ncbi:MAG TPA: MFS transporter, partial [Burkholderiales bacterium]|nr:MFS transporter [Burkholderiales bacterium]